MVGSEFHRLDELRTAIHVFAPLACLKRGLVHVEDLRLIHLQLDDNLGQRVEKLLDI